MNSIPRSALAAVGVMLLLVVAALLWRGSVPVSGAANVSWAEKVENARDHVTPADLTDWLLRDSTSVALVDLRSVDEFKSFHLPGAVRLDLPALFGHEGERLLVENAGRTVVLYSNGMVHPAQAWSQLAARGHSNVRVLEGGLTQLFHEVLTPPSLRGPISEARARSLKNQFAAARRLYFGAEGTTKDSTPAHLDSAPNRLEAPTVVSTAWVARRGNDLVLLDARSDVSEYTAGHLPGARHVPIARTRGPRGDVPEELLAPSDLARVFGEAGVDSNTEVVIYSGAKPHDATHLLLALASLGHSRVAMMDGGLSAWTAEQRPLTDATPKFEARHYEAAPGLAGIAVQLEQVVHASRTGQAVILDVRPASEFDGQEEKEVRGGHIPRSVNRSSSEDVVAGPDGVRLRPRADLLEAYAKLGLTPDRPVIVTCRTGHKASQAWFVLRHVLGFTDVKWFDGSWQEWSKREALPAEVTVSPPR